MKLFLRLIALSLLLMSFQCHDENEHELVENTFKISITPQSNFTVNDIIWIDGIISSKLYNLTIIDSISYDFPPSGHFSVMKLIEPTQTSNSKDAIDKFELINSIGEFSFTGFCENSELNLSTELSIGEQFYTYRVGLKAISPGDYVLSWTKNNTLVNENRNEFIIDNYPLSNHPDQLGFDKCGNVSWLFLDDSKNEFYFTVN